jgi:starch synthase (maltosyl-transferring)
MPKIRAFAAKSVIFKRNFREILWFSLSRDHNNEAARTRRAVVRERSNFLAELRERSPADATGPRFFIEDIFPSVDGGHYPVKRIAGESVDVWADIFREGHDVLAAALLWRREIDTDWRRVAMEMDSNDRWHGSFTPPAPGTYLYAIEAWTDQFATWRKEFAIRRDAGQDLLCCAKG